MTAGQICIRGVETATNDESVYVAARRMNDHNVDSLVIVDGTGALPLSPAVI